MTETRTVISLPTERDVSIKAHIGILQPTQLNAKNLVVLISVPKGLNAGDYLGPEPLLYRTMLECFNLQLLRIEKYNKKQREKARKCKRIIIYPVGRAPAFAPDCLYLTKMKNGEITVSSKKNGTKKLALDEARTLQGLEGLTFPENSTPIEIIRDDQPELVKQIISICEPELKAPSLTIIFGAGLGSNAPFKRSLSKEEVTSGLAGYKEVTPTIEGLSKHLTKSFGDLVYNDEERFIKQDEEAVEDLKKDPKFLLNGYSRIVMLSNEDELKEPESNVLYLKKIKNSGIEAYSLLNGTKTLTLSEAEALNSITELTFPESDQKPIEITRNQAEALVDKVSVICGYDFLKYKVSHWKDGCQALSDFKKNYELAEKKYQENPEFQKEMEKTRDDFFFRGSKLTTLLAEFKTNASALVSALEDFDFLKYANIEAIKTLLEEVSFFKCHKNTIFFYSKQKMDDGFVSTFKEEAKEITSLAISFKELDVDKLEETQPVAAISKPFTKPSKFSKAAQEEEKTKVKKPLEKTPHPDAFFNKKPKSVHFAKEKPVRDKKINEQHVTSAPIAIPKQGSPKNNKLSTTKDPYEFKFEKRDRPLREDHATSAPITIPPKQISPFKKKPHTPKSIKLFKAIDELSNSPPSKHKYDTLDKLLRVLKAAGHTEHVSPSPPSSSPKEEAEVFDFPSKRELESTNSTEELSTDLSSPASGLRRITS